jgi:REP element-mobilizing transposase RayT
MPRNIRMFEKDRVYLITNRTAEGLPFVATILINLFIYGIIARAISLHPEVKVCHFIFMANHYHLLIVLKGDPDALKSFMEYFDGETAKFINRFRGRTGHNVWVKPYDAEAILTFEAALNKIIYIYLNPVTAGLVNSIKDYPGVSSWRFFLKSLSRPYRFLGSAGLKRLPFGGITKQISCEILRKKHANTRFQEKNLLLINPIEWAYCFNEGKGKTDKEIRKLIFEGIEEGEKKIRRQRNGRPVLGAFNLSKQCFHKKYKSKTYQKRSICISTCSLIKEDFLKEYREFVRLCREAWYLFKRTRGQAQWPPGAFPPARVVFASAFVSTFA